MPKASTHPTQPPAAAAAAVYRSEPCTRSFREDLEAHLLGGWVISTPAAFAMGRPVQRSAPAADILNPWHQFPAEHADAWLIYLAAGDLRQLLRWIPHPLPWIGWERSNKLRWYRASRLPLY